MKKFLAVAMLSATLVLSAQIHTTEMIQPAVLPHTSVDYDSQKPLVIRIDGVYVCPDKYEMYIGAWDKKQNAMPFLEKLPNRARLISTQEKEIIAVCIAVHDKK